MLTDLGDSRGMLYQQPLAESIGLVLTDVRSFFRWPMSPFFLQVVRAHVLGTNSSVLTKVCSFQSRCVKLRNRTKFRYRWRFISHAPHSSREVGVISLYISRLKYVCMLHLQVVQLFSVLLRLNEIMYSVMQGICSAELISCHFSSLLHYPAVFCSVRNKRLKGQSTTNSNMNYNQFILATSVH